MKARTINIFLSALFALAILITPGLVKNAGACCLLGEYYHYYGTGCGDIDPGGNDPLYYDYVLVKDTSTDPFHDSFDFSGLNAGCIEYFELVLKFSNTADDNYNDYEDWKVNPGNSSNPDDLMDMVRTTEAVYQSFIIDEDIDTFTSMVDNETFDLWFKEMSGNGYCYCPTYDSFKLYKAKLYIYGCCTPPVPPQVVPEPGTVALVGLGLIGLYAFRKRIKL